MTNLEQLIIWFLDKLKKIESFDKFVWIQKPFTLLMLNPFLLTQKIMFLNFAAIFDVTCTSFLSRYRKEKYFDSILELIVWFLEIL